MKLNKKNIKINWFRKYSIWFIIISVIGIIINDLQKNNATLFWFIIMCISGYYYIKDFKKTNIKNINNNNRNEKENENNNWFKKHPIISVLLIFIIFSLIGKIIEKTDININNYNKCKPFIESKIPNKIILDDKYNMLTNWTDETKIFTLKNYRKVEGEGVWTTIKTGDFEFRKGSKVGENINKYYIETKIGSGTAFGGELENGPAFYFQYNKKQKTRPDGKILPNKVFKIIPLNITIKKIEDKYYFNFTDYKIISCENII